MWKKVICLDHYLEVFTYIWILTLKQSSSSSVDGSLVLKEMEKVKIKVQDVRHIMAYGWRWDLYSKKKAY